MCFKMILPENERRLFFRLYFRLLLYVNRKYKLYSVDSIEALKCLGEGVLDIRNKLYDDPKVIQEFVRENPYNLSKEELGIVSNWRHFVRGNFVLLKCLKKYAIFLDTSEPPKAYGVLALSEPFSEIGLPIPTFVETVLLPFKGKIIFDGIMKTYPVIIGPNIKRELGDMYRRAKSMFGIIISLPFTGKEKMSDEEKLRLYLRTKRSRMIHAEEIEELIRKNPRLLDVYHQEMGKIAARKYKRELRKKGITRGWFAILDEEIIASGRTREELEKILDSIIPKDRKKHVYIFKL